MEAAFYAYPQKQGNLRFEPRRQLRHYRSTEKPLCFTSVFRAIVVQIVWPDRKGREPKKFEPPETVETL
jgi:hypothetical protein